MKSPTSFNITITPAALEKWKRELEELDEQMKTLEIRRQKLSARIHSVQWFIDDEEPQVPMPGIAPVRQADQFLENPPQEKLIAQMGVPEAIRHILKKFNRPMGKAEIKQSLKANGFPMGKLGFQGGYFYTVLGRMEKSKVITRDGDSIQLT